MVRAFEHIFTNKYSDSNNSTCRYRYNIRHKNAIGLKGLIVLNNVLNVIII